MNYSELKEFTDQYIETFSALGPARGHSRSLLNGFLWWLYPQMKDEDLPTYEEWPLKKIPVPSYPLEEYTELYGPSTRARLFTVRGHRSCPRHL